MIARPALLAGSALLVASSLGCGPRRPSTPAGTSTDAGAAISSTDGGATTEIATTLDELAARGPSEAPLMREIQRVADASRPVELRADRDACFRVAFAASSAARAWLEDDAKATRGDAVTGTTTGMVPARGPACARKGETLRFVIDAVSAGGRKPSARAIVWQSP